MKLSAVLLFFAFLSALAFAQTSPSGPVKLPLTTTPITTSTTSRTSSATPASVDTVEDIRDIHGPISIPYEYLWALYLLAAVALAVALYYGWRAYRRRALARARQPHELALDRLEYARSLMNENQVREYAFEVSEIVRRYIEQRFGERAARRTTEEFLSELLTRNGTPLAEHRDLLENFLQHCDLPKYARWQLSVPEMEGLHESARSFIFNTRPQPKAATPKIGSAQPELVSHK